MINNSNIIPIDYLSSPNLNTTDKTLVGTINEINEKEYTLPTASKQTKGVVWYWEDGGVKYVWNIDPNQVHNQTEVNLAGGMTNTIKTMNYTMTTNMSGGITYTIGE